MSQEINLLLTENENFRFAEVVFNDNIDAKKYSYKTIDTTLEEGDLLVVDANGTFKVVMFVGYSDGIKELASNIYYKWVVQKVDRTHFDKCIEVEKALEATLHQTKRKKLVKESSAELADAVVLKAYKNLKNW